MLARRAHIEVIYQDKDITNHINNDLLSFSYTDNASGSADDVSIDLEDARRKWISNWRFEQGDTFEVNIVTLNWRKNGERHRLPCGVFMVDEPEYHGRPSIISLKGVSVPANSNFMHTKRTKTWKNISLKALASEIAGRYGLQLFYDSKLNPTFKEKSQDATDAGFLQETCEDEGFALKVTDKKLILFNEREYENKKEIATFHENNSTILSYSFKPTLTNTAYAGVSLKYYDARRKKNIEYLFSLGEIDPEKDKVYKLNRKVSDVNEAKRLAQSTLRKLNKKQVTATLEIVGDTRMLASSTIMLKGFGSLDGKYYIDKATHSLSSYTTSLELHKTLGGGY